MGEIQNTKVDGDARMLSLKLKGRLKKEYQDRKYYELSAGDQYQIDRDYDEMKIFELENPTIESAPDPQIEDKIDEILNKEGFPGEDECDNTEDDMGDESTNEDGGDGVTLEDVNSADE